MPSVHSPSSDVSADGVSAVQRDSLLRAADDCAYFVDIGYRVPHREGTGTTVIRPTVHAREEHADGKQTCLSWQSIAKRPTQQGDARMTTSTFGRTLLLTTTATVLTMGLAVAAFGQEV